MTEGKGIFPPGTARHGPPSQKRRDACKRLVAYRTTLVVWTADLDARLMELVADDFSFTQIGRLMDLSPTTVSSRFTRLRLAMGWQAA